MFETVCQNLFISASTTDFFKNKLDRFWSNREIMHDYKTGLTRVGIRSFLNNFD